MDQPDLLGINEVARLAGVSRQAVVNWRNRNLDFPPSIAELGSGPVFDGRKIRRWLTRKGFKMARIISLINLKGGVAKTTTTVSLAETLSSQFNKKVLVIDLDPQTNATVMLIGEDRWGKLNSKGLTLATLFKDALSSDEDEFNLHETLQKNVSDVRVTRIDLLPSSLDLIDVQDKLANAPSGQFYANTPVDFLRKAIKPILENYDFVLIDCPPNLGIITLNGLRISEGYLIPSVPDVLSTYGIPQIVKRVSNFAKEVAENIDPIGIIVTKFQINSTIHVNGVRRLRKENDPPVFTTQIRQANQIASAAEFQGGSRTLKQKYGYGDLADTYVELANELLEALGEK